jgi:hypothetical protein
VSKATSVLRVLLLGASALLVSTTAAAQTTPDEPDSDDTGDESSASPTTSSSTSSGDALDTPSATQNHATVRPPAHHQAADDDDEEEAPANQLPWRNTFFAWTNAVTFNSFFREAQLSYDPVYYQDFALSPRWYFDAQNYFWVSETMEIELTDTDDGVYNHEPLLSDTLIEFRHVIPWEGFQFTGSVRLALPLSKASQFAQRYFQTGLGLSVVRPIPEAYLTVSGSVGYRVWWGGSNVVVTGTPQPDECPPTLQTNVPPGSTLPETSPTCGQLGTSSLGEHTLVGGLNVGFSYENFSAGVSFAMSATRGYDLAPASVHVATSPEPLIINDDSRTHWRNTLYLSISVGYQVLPWLALELGIQNSGGAAPLYSSDASVRNPLFTPDTQVYLNTTFQLDEIYNQITGTSEELSPQERERRRQGLASRQAGGAL